MPIIGPASTQLVLQMSPLAEKLQQTSQQQPAALVQQLNEEDRAKLNELKRTEIQDPESKDPLEPTNQDGKSGQGRLRFKQDQESKETEGEEASETLRIADRPQGSRLDVVA